MQAAKKIVLGFLVLLLSACNPVVDTAFKEKENTTIKYHFTADLATRTREITLNISDIQHIDATLTLTLIKQDEKGSLLEAKFTHIIDKRSKTIPVPTKNTYYTLTINTDKNRLDESTVFAPKELSDNPFIKNMLVRLPFIVERAALQHYTLIQSSSFQIELNKDGGFKALNQLASPTNENLKNDLGSQLFSASGLTEFFTAMFPNRNPAKVRGGDQWPAISVEKHEIPVKIDDTKDSSGITYSIKLDDNTDKKDTDKNTYSFAYSGKINSWPIFGKLKIEQTVNVKAEEVYFTQYISKTINKTITVQQEL